MNYIKEINAFYDWLELNSLSTSGIVLWHALMHINNKAGWAAEFTVAISTLCVKTGLSPRAVTKARNELKQKGCIDWRSRKGNQSAIYKVIPLSASSARNSADKDVDNDLSAPDAGNRTDNRSDSRTDNGTDNRAILNKQNETKQNNYININAREDDLLKIINQLDIKCRGIHDLESLESYVGMMEKELVVEALKRSQSKNVPYAVTILEDWKAKKIFDVSELRTKQGKPPRQEGEPYDELATGTDGQPTREGKWDHFVMQ